VRKENPHTGGFFDCGEAADVPRKYEKRIFVTKSLQIRAFIKKSFLN
jgi:hypothetical protein